MIETLRKHLRILLELFSLDPSSMLFKKRLSQQIRPQTTKSKSAIMIEFEQSPENVIALSIFLPILLEYFDSKLIAYQLTSRKGLRKLVKVIQFRLSTTCKLMGTKYISINLKGSQNISRHEVLWQNIKTAEELELFEYSGIRIGDLIYDEYLARSNMHTLDLTDLRVRKIFIQAVTALEWWIEFVERQTVDAFIVSHDVYLYGIPARLGVTRGIPVFLVSTSEIIRLNHTYPRVGADIPRYPELFLEQDLEFRTAGVNAAKKKLQNRIKGVGPSDLYYFPLVAFAEAQSEKKYLKISNRKKILIAVHDFYDSPHGGQVHFYPDFYLWLLALSKIASELDYDWYIKTHPYLRGRGRAILADFVLSNPQFELLPPEVTHNDIIAEGIDLALTVYGTIATEYPLLGVPVLNASSHNPHASYKFSITPQSRGQYESYIKNIESIPPVGNTEQIYEYYFMHHLLPLRNWLFMDDARYKKETGFGLNPMTREIYRYFLETNNLVPIEEIQFAMRCFIESNSYKLGRDHFRIPINPSIDNL